MLLLQRMLDQRGLLVRRKGDVEDLDRIVADQVFRRIVNLGNAPTLRDLLGVSLGARCDRSDRKASLLVSREMALGHDHARADASDPVVLRSDLHIRLKSFCVRHGPPPRFFIAPTLIARWRRRPH